MPFILASGCYSAFVFAEAENKLDLSVEAEAGYIDNFLYQVTDEESTAFYNLSSLLAFESKRRQSLFNVNAKVNSYVFQDFKDDNHTDFSFMPEYQFKFAQNQRLYMSAHWRNSYVYRGTGLSLGEAISQKEGDEKEDVGAKLGFEYGNADSQARLNVALSYNEGEFSTRRDQTNILDSEIIDLTSSFDYLLSGKTYMAFDADYRKVDYPNNPLNNRDSFTGLVGVKWQTTVISELSFLIGYQNLKFENNAAQDDDAFKWRFDYTWRPSDFTKVHILSDRKFEESNRLTNSYRLGETYQMDVSHAFTDHINIFAAISFNNEDFITPENKQEENYIGAELALNYRRNEWVSFSLNYQYKSLNANYADIDYLYNSLSLGVKVSL